MKYCSLILYLFKRSHLESRQPQICGATLLRMECDGCVTGLFTKCASFLSASDVIRGDLVSASANIALFLVIEPALCRCQAAVLHLIVIITL